MRGKRVVYTYIFGILLLVASLTASLMLGAVKINIPQAISSAFLGEEYSPEMRILLFLRLPRCIGAVFAGSALAVSGVLIQALLNNPMASPNIIGVNSGAGLAVIATVSLFPSLAYIIPITAFLGALLSCALIYVAALKCGAGRVTVTLVGIAVTSILNALISAFKTIFPTSAYNMTTFSIGGLGGVNGGILAVACPLILFFIVCATFMSRGIDVLSLGDDTAHSLGLNVKLFKLTLMLFASALAGAAVSFAGLLGFVGLVVPHIVRRFTGDGHFHLILLSALFGGEFVLACDSLCRILFKPYEIPVGILLSFIGGIFFIFLILTYRKGRGYDRA